MVLYSAMINALRWLWLALLLIILALGGGTGESAPVDASTINSQAVQTAAAQLTQAAQTGAVKFIQSAQIADADETDLAQTESARLDLAVLTVAARMTQDAAIFTPSPGVSPTPIPPTPTPTSIYENCDRAELLTIALSGQILFVALGSLFEQSWSIRNIGTCTWNPDYALELTNGEFLGGTSIIIPTYVRPGQTVELTTRLIAPSKPGNYLGYWYMRNAGKETFGFGPNGDAPLVMQVIVSELPGGHAYDFALNYFAAQWRNAMGQVPCSGIVDEVGGQVSFIDRDLSFLAGQPVRFIFTVSVQNNQPDNANAVWVRPRIE